MDFLKRGPTHRRLEESGRPKLMMCSFFCLLPLLGFHISVAHVRVKGHILFNSLMEQLDRNLVPLTAILLSMLFVFNTKANFKKLLELFQSIICPLLKTKRTNFSSKGNTINTEGNFCIQLVLNEF